MGTHVEVPVIVTNSCEISCEKLNELILTKVWVLTIIELEPIAPFGMLHRVFWIISLYLLAGDIDPVTVKIANWLLIRQPEL